MNAFVEWVSQPWPWYVAGPIIGLMVPLHLILLNRTFGVSSSFRHMCAAVVPSKLEFLNYDWKKEGWNLLFVVGILGGAWLAATVFSSDAPIALSDAAVARMNAFWAGGPERPTPQELFSWDALLAGGRGCSSSGRVPGGFRHALRGGCTSGHAIMGLSHFQLPSFVAVLGFFTGGLLMSWLILPLLLS